MRCIRTLKQKGPKNNVMSLSPIWEWEGMRQFGVERGLPALGMPESLHLLLGEEFGIFGGSLAIV